MEDERVPDGRYEEHERKMTANDQPAPSVDDLWRIVQDQRRRIDELDHQRRRSRVSSVLERRSIRLLTVAVALAAILLNAGPRAWVANAASSSANSFWSQTGNDGTNPATNYLGTSNNQPLVLKTNGTEAVRLLPGSNGVGGNVGIGTTTPATKLDVNGSIHGSANLSIDNNASVGGGLSVTGAISGDSLSIAHNGTIGGDLGVTGTLSAGSLGEGGTPLSSKYAFVGGSNATGTWPINTTGNAGSVTHGVYTLGDQTIFGKKSFYDLLSAPSGITAGGTVESTSGGFTFPDGTTQTTAATTGSLDIQTVESTVGVNCCAFNLQNYTVSCPSGYSVVSGGYATLSTAQHIWRSYPADSSSWEVQATDDLGPDNLYLYAVCLKFSP